MLGQDASFAQFFVLKLIESRNIQVKKIGYLACSLLLEQENDLKILLGASIQKDLQNDQNIIVYSALNALSKLLNASTAPNFLNEIIKLLEHKNKKIVQKALVVLQRIEKLSPNSVPLYSEKIKNCFQSPHPTIISAALNVIAKEVKENREVYVPILPSLISLQNQII